MSKQVEGKRDFVVNLLNYNFYQFQGQKKLNDIKVLSRRGVVMNPQNYHCIIFFKNGKFCALKMLRTIADDRITWLHVHLGAYGQPAAILVIQNLSFYLSKTILSYVTTHDNIKRYKVGSTVIKHNICFIPLLLKCDRQSSDISRGGLFTLYFMKYISKMNIHMNIYEMLCKTPYKIGKLAKRTCPIPHSMKKGRSKDFVAAYLLVTEFDTAKTLCLMLPLKKLYGILQKKVILSPFKETYVAFCKNVFSAILITVSKWKWKCTDCLEKCTDSLGDSWW